MQLAKLAEGFIRRVWSTDVLRSGYLLALSTGLTSMLGIVFWSVAARNYSAEQVGINATIISVLITMGNVAQLNMINILHRFLSQEGTAVRKLIIAIYIITICFACLITILFLRINEAYGFEFARYFSGAWQSALFVLAIVLWTLYLLQDAVLVGLRQSAIVPAANTVYAVAKVLLLVALPALALLNSSQHIFLAWIIPLLPILLAVNFYIFRHLNARRPDTDSFNLRPMLNFYGWDYAGSVASLCALGVQPLIVLQTHGAVAAASYHFAWMIAYPLYLICRSMGMSLVAEAAASPQNRSQLIVDALIHTLLPLTLAVVTTMMLARWIIGFFGAAYVEAGAPTLQLFALAMLPWGFTTLFLAWARAISDTRIVAVVQGTTALMIVPLTYLFLRLMGLPGAGLALLVTQLMIASGVVFFLSKYGVNFSQQEIAIAMAREIAAMANALKALFHRPGRSPKAIQGVPVSLRHLPHLNGMAAHTSTVSLSAVQTFLFSAGADALPSIAAKIARSDDGIAALKRSSIAVQKLQSDPRLSARTFAIPQILEEIRGASSYTVIERALPGTDGRMLMSRDPNMVSRFAAAASVLQYLSVATAARLTPDAAWISAVIKEPVASLQANSIPFFDSREQQKTLEGLAASLQAHFISRSVPAALAHGDYCPANLIFAPSVPPETSQRLIGVVDWETMHANMPLGFDAVHFLMTLRCASRSQELGRVAMDFIDNPVWSEPELHWFTLALPAEFHDLPTDCEAMRATAQLAWLHHVANNMVKSDKYRKGILWRLNNVGVALEKLHAKAVCSGL